jgi:hypothetical protein
MQSKVTATGMIANPDTPEAYLVVEIAFDCPECGKARYQIPGHHLKALRDIAISYCDQFPALTAASVSVLDTISFQSRPGTRPEEN